MGVPGGSVGKESTCNVGDLGSVPGVEDALEKGKVPTPVFWPGEFQGLHSPWGHKESHMTEQLSLSLSWVIVGFPGSASGKEPTRQCRRLKIHGFNPWVRKIPWRRVWQSTPVFLPGESHGWRSLAVHTPWGRRVRHN